MIWTLKGWWSTWWRGTDENSHVVRTMIYGKGREKERKKSKIKSPLRLLYEGKLFFSFLVFSLSFSLSPSGRWSSKRRETGDRQKMDASNNTLNHHSSVQLIIKVMSWITLRSRSQVPPSDSVTDSKSKGKSIELKRDGKRSRFWMQLFSNVLSYKSLTSLQSNEILKITNESWMLLFFKHDRKSFLALFLFICWKLSFNE